MLAACFTLALLAQLLYHLFGRLIPLFFLVSFTSNQPVKYWYILHDIAIRTIPQHSTVYHFFYLLMGMPFLFMMPIIVFSIHYWHTWFAWFAAQGYKFVLLGTANIYANIILLLLQVHVDVFQLNMLEHYFPTMHA
jgi:hypothetical protein